MNSDETVFALYDFVGAIEYTDERSEIVERLNQLKETADGYTVSNINTWIKDFNGQERTTTKIKSEMVVWCEEMMNEMMEE